MKKEIYIILLILVLGAGFFIGTKNKENIVVTNFEECAKHNPVATSYPAQCYHDGVHYVQNIGNELEMIDVIRINNPRPGATIESPLVVTGDARGFWFFEATAPVSVVDWNGVIIGEGFIQATKPWMTEDFVPFSGDIIFDTNLIQNQYSDKGTLILRNHNASGLSEHDQSLEIPIIFQ